MFYKNFILSSFLLIGCSSTDIQQPTSSDWEKGKFCSLPQLTIEGVSNGRSVKNAGITLSGVPYEGFPIGPIEMKYPAVIDASASAKLVPVSYKIIPYIPTEYASVTPTSQTVDMNCKGKDPISVTFEYQ